MLYRTAFVVQYHCHACLFVVGFPFGQSLDVGIASLDERQPDAADGLLKCVCLFGCAGHLALQTDIVQYERLCKKTDKNVILQLRQSHACHTDGEVGNAVGKRLDGRGYGGTCRDDVIDDEDVLPVE